jgi:GAF domain-containing protein
MATITLLDAKRQWFKSKVGVTSNETPIEHAFCSHSIDQRGVFTVEDAREDERFAANPLVTGNPHIRFYAGAPLVTDDGIALGTICVIDNIPRSLTPQQEQALTALGRQVIRQMEQRRTSRELSTTLEEKEEALKHVQKLQGLLPICAYCNRIRDDKNYWTEISEYFAVHSEMRFTHGICPTCYPKARENMGLPPKE